MNIFFLSLDYDPTEAARFYVDKHVIKIITEINQMAANAYKPGIAPYKITHKNHPMTKWCCASLGNFQWAINHCLALCAEYTHRYGKVHKGEVVANWYLLNLPPLPDLGFQSPPQCFGAFQDECFSLNNTALAYRNYYIRAKSHLFHWKNRGAPNWIEESKHSSLKSY